MKNILAVSALVALAFTSNAVSAQNLDTKPAAINNSETLKVRIEEVKPLQFRIVVENPTKQKFNIALEDNDQNILFNEYSVVSSKYGKVLDLSNVNDGVYTFTIFGKNNKIEKTFEIVSRTNRTATALALGGK